MVESIGAYRITGIIGEGGMGVVYRGFDPAIQREVAIKAIRLKPVSPQERAELRARFCREATAAGRLSHPNLVTIYQFGEENECQFLVMELVAGASLERILTETPPDVETSLGWLAQIASGLDHAHGNGVFHRDVKPANILVRPDGIVKITDFGIAKVPSETITRTGFAIGTPAYMAPEQITATHVDGRADQFALAVIAYQMLSGRRPFNAPSDHALMFQIVHAEPAPVHEANSALPPNCAAVLEKALAKDPAARFATCSEFIRALAAAVRQPASETVLPPPPFVAVAAAPAFVAAPGPVTPAPLRGLRWEFARIPPGEFLMGSDTGDADERPVHRVRITRQFEMARYLATQAQWEAVMGTNPSHFKGTDRPVESVSWDDARLFIARLNAMNDGYTYRLASEAEWEYAARAGTVGHPPADLDAVAWYTNNSGGQTHPVGQKQPNPWGLYDVLGNVWEWCSDWYDASYYREAPPSDPRGPATGEGKAVRGGSWSGYAWLTRTTLRSWAEPGSSGFVIGFRLVREAGLAQRSV